MIPPRFLWLGQTETDFRSVFNLATDGVGGRHVLNPVSKGFNRIALIFKYDLVFLFGFYKLRCRWKRRLSPRRLLAG